ncbi:MAG: queuosine salvage family protein [Solirubrobacteraceae bacterium]
MSLLDSVRASCAEVAAGAREVQIDLDALSRLAPESAPALDAEAHWLDGPPQDVADFMLALDAINFGSGWFPTLRKRIRDERPLSGYVTIATAFSEHARASGPPAEAWLRDVTAREIARILGQDPGSELMSLYAQALRSLGRFLAGRRALDLVEQAGHCAERLAEMLACGMPFFDDRGFYKRAQIVGHDLALAGVAEPRDLHRLTIFADNLVPHVLRCEGVLRYSPDLAARIDAGEVLRLGGMEREIRACALHACELLSQRTGIAPRMLDRWLWNLGQAREYKDRPRHRCRTVFY